MDPKTPFDERRFRRMLEQMTPFELWLMLVIGRALLAYIWISKIPERWLLWQARL